MEQDVINKPSKYYEEIKDCVQLESLANYLQDKNNEIESLERGYRGRKLNALVVWAIIGGGLYTYFGTFDKTTVEVIAAVVALVGISLWYNIYNDKKIRSKVDSLAADINEKQDVYNKLYAYIEKAYNNGDFSIEKDYWHCGNELMQYYHHNGAFSFKEGAYYVEKRKEREARERELNNAYNEGYNAGYNEGYSVGYEKGKQDGYGAGKSAGSSSAYWRGVGDGRYLR